MNVLYAQIIGAAAMLTISFSVQCKKKKNMMAFQIIANILYAIEYSFLNAFSASLMNIMVVLRGLLYYNYDKQNKRIPLVLPIIVCLCITILGYFIYETPLTLIPILITLAYTISASFKNPKIYKIVFGVCAFIWILYNIKVQAYICIIGNVLEIVSTFIAIKRTKK